MKSQLLQCCQGCVPSNSKPNPGLPQGEGAPAQPPQTQQEGTPAPWGGLGEGLPQAAVFVPAKAGLFERPEAAFFTVAADGVMHRITVGIVETARRKTRFPTVGTTVHAKAKPPSATTAFLYLFYHPSRMQKIVGRTHNCHHASSSNIGVIVGRKPASSSNSVGVAIPQPRVAGEARYPG